MWKNHLLHNKMFFPRPSLFSCRRVLFCRPLSATEAHRPAHLTPLSQVCFGMDLVTEWAYTVRDDWRLPDSPVSFVAPVWVGRLTALSLFDKWTLLITKNSPQSTNRHSLSAHKYAEAEEVCVVAGPVWCMKIQIWKTVKVCTIYWVDAHKFYVSGI